MDQFKEVNVEEMVERYKKEMEDPEELFLREGDVPNSKQDDAFDCEKVERILGSDKINLEDRFLSEIDS